MRGITGLMPQQIAVGSGVKKLFEAVVRAFADRKGNGTVRIQLLDRPQNMHQFLICKISILSAL
ncbi:hypothetical protein IMSAGC020_00327 [Lachnospiraceae bacterium]|nr:hypothetical protein IMSAGC020_00327 [Lachnospiraceae bacterium]